MGQSLNTTSCLFSAPMLKKSLTGHWLCLRPFRESYGQAHGLWMQTLCGNLPPRLPNCVVMVRLLFSGPQWRVTRVFSWAPIHDGCLVSTGRRLTISTRAWMTRALWEPRSCRRWWLNCQENLGHGLHTQVGGIWVRTFLGTHKRLSWEHSWEPRRGYHENIAGSPEEAIMGPTAESCVAKGWTLDTHQEQKRKCVFFGRCSNSPLLALALDMCESCWLSLKARIRKMEWHHLASLSGIQLRVPEDAWWGAEGVGLFTIHHPAWYPQVLVKMIF